MEAGDTREAVYSRVKNTAGGSHAWLLVPPSLTRGVLHTRSMNEVIWSAKGAWKPAMSTEATDAVVRSSKAGRVD